MVTLRRAVPEDAPLDEFLAASAKRFAKARRHGRYRGEQIRRDLGRIGAGRRLYGALVNILPFEEAPDFPGLATEIEILGTGPVDDITITRKYQMDDADVVLISFGCSVRSSLSAIEILRKKGVKAGLLQLVTVWPMPEKEIRAALQQAKTVIVPELNLGQLAGEVRKYNDYGCKVLQANRTDGILITPQQIVDVYEESEK